MPGRILRRIKRFRSDAEVVPEEEAALRQALARMPQLRVVEVVLEACGRRILRNNDHDPLTFCGDPPEG